MTNQEPTRSVEVYHGSPPSVRSEVNFLKDLKNELIQNGRRAIIFANFEVGVRQVDFFVATPQSCYFVELKSFKKSVRGQKNGRWEIQRQGTWDELSKENPYQQTKRAKFKFSDEMATFAKSTAKPGAKHGDEYYYDFEAVTCFYPSKPKNSNLPKSDKKVKLWSYAEFIDAIDSPSKSPSWDLADWRDFASHLGLDDQSSVRSALVTRYRQSFSDYYKPPETYVELPLKVDGERTDTETVRTAIKNEQHVQIVGPSGSGKTHLTKQLVLDLFDSDAIVPVWLDSRMLEDTFKETLRRQFSHLGVENPKGLLNELQKQPSTPVLVLDGLQNLEEPLRSQLAACVQNWEMTLLVTLHEPTSLGVQDEPVIAHTSELRDKEKLELFEAYYGDETPSSIHSTIVAFDAPFEIELAADCAEQLPPEILSRYQLLTIYIDERVTDIPTNPATARKIFTHLAREFAESIRWSMPLPEYFRRAERTASNGNENTAEYLFDTDIIRRQQGTVSFAHEQFQEYFETQALLTKDQNTESLHEALLDPHYQHLRRFALEATVDSFECRDLLQRVGIETLRDCLHGKLGAALRKEVLEQGFRLLQDVLSESNFSVRLHAADEEQETLGSCKLSSPDAPPSSDFQQRLSYLIGEHWPTDDWSNLALELFERINTAFRNVECSKKTIPNDDLTGTAISKAIAFADPEPSSTWSHILNGAGTAACWNSPTPEPTHISKLLNNSGSIGVWVAVNTLRRANLQNEQKSLWDLAPAAIEHAWKTGIYHIQLSGLYLSETTASAPDKTREKVRNLLQTFEHPDHIMLNTALIDALQSHGLIDNQSVDPSGRIDELLEAPRHLQSQNQAVGIVNHMHDGPYQDTYHQAVQNRPKEQRQQLYLMALNAQDFVGILSTIIPLAELFYFVSEENVELQPRRLARLSLEKWATITDPIDNPTPSELLRAFLLSNMVIAAAEIDKSMGLEHSGDKRPWNSLAQLIRKSTRQLLGKQSLPTQTNQEIFPYESSEYIEELLAISNEGLKVASGIPNPLLLEQRDLLRRACETALRTHPNLDSQPRFLPPTQPLGERLIRLLGDIGSPQSIPILEGFTDSSRLGKPAVTAIRQIRRRCD